MTDINAIKELLNTPKPTRVEANRHYHPCACCGKKVMCFEDECNHTDIMCLWCALEEEDATA